jgi:hypothetical protein
MSVYLSFRRTLRQPHSNAHAYRLYVFNDPKQTQQQPQPPPRLQTPLRSAEPRIMTQIFALGQIILGFVLIIF